MMNNILGCVIFCKFRKRWNYVIWEFLWLSLQVTKRLDETGTSWNWRTSGDIFLNGAFFTASGASGANSQFYAKATSFSARPASMVQYITLDSGPLACSYGAMCWSSSSSSSLYHVKLRVTINANHRTHACENENKLEGFWFWMPKNTTLIRVVCWICEIVKRPCIHGDQVLAMPGRPCQEYNVMHSRPDGIRCPKLSN